jgi:DNA-binding NtrC family response regulator
MRYKASLNPQEIAIPSSAPYDSQDECGVVGRIKPKVLMIDDDPLVADTLAMVLNASGFESTVAYSGEHAVALARETAFEHLVADVILGGMNGIEAAVAIRQLHPRCHVILLSGSNDTAALLAAAATQGHVFEILAKPVHPTLMLEIMRSSALAG